jgi:hypothetical protein
MKFWVGWAPFQFLHIKNFAEKISKLNGKAVVSHLVHHCHHWTPLSPLNTTITTEHHCHHWTRLALSPHHTTAAVTAPRCHHTAVTRPLRPRSPHRCRHTAVTTPAATTVTTVTVYTVTTATIVTTPLPSHRRHHTAATTPLSPLSLSPHHCHCTLLALSLYTTVTTMYHCHHHVPYHCYHHRPPLSPRLLIANNWLCFFNTRVSASFGRDVVNRKFPFAWQIFKHLGTGFWWHWCLVFLRTSLTHFTKPCEPNAERHDKDVVLLSNLLATPFTSFGNQLF